MGPGPFVFGAIVLNAVLYAVVAWKGVSVWRASIAPNPEVDRKDGDEESR